MDTGNTFADVQFMIDENEMDEMAFNFLFDSSSSEEENEGLSKSRSGRAPNKDRDFVLAYQQVVAFYFNGRESVYNEADFERRFRCPRSVFNRIHDRLMGQHPFIHYQDASKKKGIFPLVKLVGCFRYLAYGDAIDREDENLQIGETTLSNIVKDFTKLMVDEFGPQYLNRPPTEVERAAIGEVMASKGFPGALASWDCKHFDWKNCPMRLSGQHKGHKDGGKITLILEAISDHGRYIWYANFGDPGSLNDLNVLDKSSIVGSLLSGHLPLKSPYPYVVNENTRDWLYFLVDGIYPEWSIFVNTFSKPSEKKKKTFASRQEAVRKDIECAFGILVSRFHILQRPLRNWYLEDIVNILHCCVILHNMIVEARAGNLGADYEDLDINTSTFPLFGRPQITAAIAQMDGVNLFAARMDAFDSMMQSVTEHYKLKYDLVEHINQFF